MFSAAEQLYVTQRALSKALKSPVDLIRIKHQMARLQYNRENNKSILTSDLSITIISEREVTCCAGDVFAKQLCRDKYDQLCRMQDRRRENAVL